MHTLSVVIAFSIYLLVGSIVNYKFKGAKGVEVIPNLSFWKELPFLIKVQKN